MFCSTIRCDDFHGDSTSRISAAQVQASEIGDENLVIRRRSFVKMILFVVEVLMYDRWAESSAKACGTGRFLSVAFLDSWWERRLKRTQGHMILKSCSGCCQLLKLPRNLSPLDSTMTSAYNIGVSLVKLRPGRTENLLIKSQLLCQLS